MTLPSTVITSTKVNQALGTSGLKAWKDLCTSEKINVDSLFKPYHVNSQVNSSFFTGGSNGMYGYTIPTTTSYNVTTFINSMWTFNKPTSYYRIGDFRNCDSTVDYNNDKWGIQVIGYVPGEDIKISCNFGNTQYLVCPKNMSGLKESYFAVSIYGGQTTSIATLTHRWSQCGTAKISSATGELITISTADFKPTDTTIVIIPFISSYNFGKTSSLASIGTGNKWSMNYNSKQEVWLSTVQANQYDVVSGTIAKVGSNGVRVNATVKKNYTANATINELSAQYELWDTADCKGNKLFTNFGLYDSTTYKYSTPIVISSPTTQPLPPADLAWSTTAYPTAKSVRVRLEDQYYHYNWEIGYINL